MSPTLLSVSMYFWTFKRWNIAFDFSNRYYRFVIWYLSLPSTFTSLSLRVNIASKYLNRDTLLKWWFYTFIIYSCRQSTYFLINIIYYVLLSLTVRRHNPHFYKFLTWTHNSFNAIPNNGYVISVGRKTNIRLLQFKVCCDIMFLTIFCSIKLKKGDNSASPCRSPVVTVTGSEVLAVFTFISVHF